MKIHQPRTALPRSHSHGLVETLRSPRRPAHLDLTTDRKSSGGSIERKRIARSPDCPPWHHYELPYYGQSSPSHPLTWPGLKFIHASGQRFPWSTVRPSIRPTRTRVSRDLCRLSSEFKMLTARPSALTVENSIYQSDGRCSGNCTDRSYAFAIVQDHNCWCSNLIPNIADRKSISECQLGCPGYPSDWCGGDGTFGYMAVVGISPTGTAPAGFGFPTTSLDSSVSAGPHPKLTCARRRRSRPLTALAVPIHFGCPA